MKRNTKPSRLVNWLERLDRSAARTRSRFELWIDSHYFMKARYPNMRPRGKSNAVGARRPGKSTLLPHDLGEARFWEDIRSQEKSLNDCTPQVLKGLSSEQSRQLAALILDSFTEIEFEARDSSQNNWVKARLRYGGGWQRRIDRKAKAVRKVAEAWLNEAAQFSKYPVIEAVIAEDGSLGEKNRSRIRLEYHPDVDAAKQVLSILDARQDAYASASWHEKNLKDSIPSRKPKNAVSKFMVYFYWFFRHECNCATWDAEVRTAMIRNRYWKGFDRVGPIAYVSEATYPDAKGSTAVRNAVSRYRLR